MKRPPYDIAVDGQPIQQIETVSVLSNKYIRERTGDFSDSRLSAKLASLATGELSVAPHEVSRMTVEAGSTGKLLEVPDLGRGRQESRRAAQFGQLLLERPQRDIAAELVAVKYTTPRLAAREFAATNTVRSRLGYDAAYEQIGFVSNGHHIGGISRYRHEVTTLDRVLWNDAATREQRLAAMAFAGVWLGTLHEHGIAHGDAQMKNIAHDSADHPIAVDLESAHDLDDPRVIPERLIANDIADTLLLQPYRLRREEFSAFRDSYLDTHRATIVADARIQAIYDQPIHPVVRYASE